MERFKKLKYCQVIIPIIFRSLPRKDEEALDPHQVQRRTINMEVCYNRLDKVRRSKERFRTTYFQNMLDSLKVLGEHKPTKNIRKQKNRKTDFTKYFSSSDKENFSGLQRNKRMKNQERKNLQTQQLANHLDENICVIHLARKKSNGKTKYVKIKDYSVSTTESFSEMDQAQFENVQEGRKHTDFWITYKPEMLNSLDPNQTQAKQEEDLLQGDVDLPETENSPINKDRRGRIK